MPGTREDFDLIHELQEQERKQLNKMPQLPPRDSARIHYTKLADPIPGSPITAEWEYYRREVGRLLAEGHEGQWVLIKGEQIVGIWNTEEEADRVRIERFLMQPVLLKQILTWEPVLRGGGYLHQWPN
jgi:hypothetical protein